MNKKSMGSFLRDLRKENGLTLKQLSNKLKYGTCAFELISRWERGESTPNILDLQKLAEYYKVSVDEILNGARYEDIDFEEKYFICNSEWMSCYNPDDLYNIREEQELRIEKRFKELLKKMVGEGLSLQEDKEFDFIVNNFYQIFLPAIEWNGPVGDRDHMLGKCAKLEKIDEWCHECLPGGLSDIKFEIYNQIAFRQNTTIEERYWEASKKFVFDARQNIWHDINNEMEENEDAVRDRISQIEDFEKDILLAALQRINVQNTLAIGSPRGRELYEKKHGQKYDEEQLTKRAIKLLIECGAKLNKRLLGYWKYVATEHSIINVLEELEKKYKLPLLVPVCENGKYKYFSVENTKQNRGKLGIKSTESAFDESDYAELERRLYAGETKVFVPDRYRMPYNDESSAFEYGREQILDMSQSAYVASRDGDATKRLEEELDALTLDEIRIKYFPEEFRGEYADDVRTMSSEELKKKYYIKGVANE